MYMKTQLLTAIATVMIVVFGIGMSYEYHLRTHANQLKVISQDLKVLTQQNVTIIEKLNSFLEPTLPEWEN